MTELYLYFWCQERENDSAPWSLRDLHDEMWNEHVKEQHSRGDQGLFPSHLVYEVWGYEADYYWGEEKSGWLVPWPGYVKGVLA